MTVTKEPYGSVDYADPGYQSDGVKRYPLDTREHAKAALSYFSMPKNAAKYSPDERVKIMARIKAACRRFGIEITDDAAPTDDDSVGSLERFYQPGLVEIRSGGNGRQIGGYAAVFGQLSKPLHFGLERIDTGFFNEARAQNWPGVVCRYEHEKLYLLGSTFGGTLRLNVDTRGLDYVCDVPQHRDDVLELVQRRDVNSSSFAFTGAIDSWDYRDQHPVRTLLSANIVDVAPVSCPAYSGTSAALRSLARWAGAPLSDVMARAERNELRGFFVRTDGGGRRRRSAAQAKAYMMGRRWGYYEAPQRSSGTRRLMSGAQAHMYMMGRRWPDHIAGRSGIATAAGDPRLAKLRLRRHRIDW